MMKKWISLALVAVMLLTVPMMAWSEGFDQQIRVDNGDVYPDNAPVEDGVLEGDLTVSETDAALDVLAHPEEGTEIPGESTLEVTGTVSLKTENSDSVAINIRADSAGTASVVVGENVESNVTSSYRFASATGVDGSAYSDSGFAENNDCDSIAKVNIDVKGNVEAEATGENVSAYATGVFIGAIEENQQGVLRAVQQDVQDETDHITETTVNVNIGGDVTATGTAIGEQNNSDAYGIRVETRGDPDVNITVGGDVTATATTGGDQNHSEAFGIMVKTHDGDPEVNITVGGTVSGDTAAILLEGMVWDQESEKEVPSTVIGDNVTLTVWEIEPNENGDYVVRQDHESFKSVEESELKAIQYIIKVQAGQEDIISTEGTSSYTAGTRTYDVAHEGDSVTLKLNIPAGYEIDGAYGNEGQTWVLTKDASGNYYLTVPRGGGVMLSVKLSAVVKAPEPERIGGPVWGDVLVTVTDKSGNATMEFLKDGTFRITGNNGSFTKGRFWFLNKLINVAENGDEANATQIILNEASKMFELSMNGSSFELSENDIKVLAGNRM